MIVPCQCEVGILETTKWKGIGWSKTCLVCEVEWDALQASHKCALRWPRGIVHIGYDELEVLIMKKGYDEEWPKRCS